MISKSVVLIIPLMLLLANPLVYSINATGQFLPSAKVITTLHLNSPPSQVNAGDKVIFTGMLTVDDSGIGNKVVTIKDKDFYGDDVLASGLTNSKGEFAIEWTTKKMDPLDNTVEVYAVFEGDSDYERSESLQYTVGVIGDQIAPGKLPTSLSLGRPPKFVTFGDLVEFTGALVDANGRAVSGVKVVIKDDTPATVDTVLESGFTDNNGQFRIKWIAKFVEDAFGATKDYVDVYAVFDGNSQLEKTENKERFRINIVTDTLVTLDVSDRKFLPGEKVGFSGRLTKLDGTPIRDATVQIKITRILGMDDILTTTKTDFDGMFMASVTPSRVSSDQILAVYAYYEDGKITGKSAYQQFAVLEPLPEFNTNELVICSLKSDASFTTAQEGKSISAQGLTGEAGILLRTRSQDVDAGRSINMPFKADPAKLIINIIKENGSIAPLAIVVYTPLTSVPIPIGDSFRTEVSTEFSTDLTVVGSGSISPSNLQWEKWGANGARLDVFSNAKLGDSVQLLISPIYHLKGRVLKESGQLGPEIDIRVHCQPKIRSLFSILTEGTSGVTPPEPVPTPERSGKLNLDINGKSFQVPYKISGGSISRAQLDVELASIKLQLDTTTSGSLIVDIPRALMDAKIDNSDIRFVVLVDGKEQPHTEESDSDSRTVSVEFGERVEEVEIIGTGILPKQPVPTADIRMVAKQVRDIVIIRISNKDSTVPVHQIEIFAGTGIIKAGKAKHESWSISLDPSHLTLESAQGLRSDQNLYLILKVQSFPSFRWVAYDMQGNSLDSDTLKPFVMGK